MIPFHRITSPTPDLNDVQLNIERFVEQLYKNPLTNAIMLSQVKIITGDNLINHGLGRNIIGIFPGVSTTSIPALKQISTFQGMKIDRSINFGLNSTSNATIDILVF